MKTEKKTKQAMVYDEYLNSNKSLKELAEEFGVAYRTINNMLCAERKKRGTYNPRKRH